MAEVVPYRLARDARTPDLVRSLERNGLAVLDGFLSPEEARSLGAEVTALIDEPGKDDLAFATGKVKRLHGGALHGVLEKRAALKRLDELGLVRGACDDFFGRGRWELQGLYAMRYRDRMPTNDKFHIDPSATVKFFYYLSDVTVPTGPFTYCIGSHREGYFRMRCGALEGTPGPKVIPDEEVRNATPIEGPAGTLIVFNSIGVHRGGDLTKGTSRLSLTYHYAAKYEQSLRKRVLRKLRGTTAVEHLCAYDEKHQSRSYPYTD